MGRTSIKNKLILSFLALLFIVMVVVGIMNLITEDFYLAQAISTALAMLAGIVFGGIFSRSLLRRLNNLSNIAREISRGDLSKDIPILSQDEVRDLEEIFAAMVSDLRNMISDMKELSLRIQETNSSLNGLVGKVVSNSKEIDKSARDIARGSEEQTRIVQETSLRVENGLKEMEEMVRKSTLTVSKISEARSNTERGEVNARETMKHLERVLKQMAEHTEPVYRLANKVEKIKLVTGVMDGIAQKTDLLSLNASIEATRAGEYGKGFALVANEIRSMAENSKHSSHEMEKIIGDILEDNKAALDSLHKSQEGINKGREIIHVIVDTFGEMLSGVKEISMEVKAMEEVTSSQAKRMRDLLSHFKDLSRLAHANFVSTQKTTIGTKNQEGDVQRIVEAMNSLGRLSEKMMEAQQRFRLK
ncbi:MAG: methyl-accepting chemotaxis protein [Pseudomonadota bacterium]